MMSKIRDLLSDRARTLRNARARLVSELREIDEEMQEIAIAIAAVERKQPLLPIAQSEQTVDELADQELTIKDMILEVLGPIPEGAEALTILQFIKDRFGKDLERTSLSPQLSRLKRDGILDLDGKAWRIASVNDEGPAEAEPSKNVGAVAGARPLDSYPLAEGSIPSASTPISPEDSELQLSDPPISNSNPQAGEKGDWHEPDC
tara:strand:- start:1187 stop:1801 length:615 start_codon:yes stop_codon:yes gene_type:complete